MGQSLALLLACAAVSSVSSSASSPRSTALLLRQSVAEVLRMPETVPDELDHGVLVKLVYAELTGDPVVHGCGRSEEHTSELQSRGHLVSRRPLETQKRE